MVALIVTLIGIVVGLAGSFFSPIMAVIGSILAAFGAWLQYRDSQPYVQGVQKDSWTQTADNQYQITIAKNAHKKQHPVVTVRDSSGSEIICDDVSNKSNDICITVNMPFPGRVEIK